MIFQISRQNIFQYIFIHIKNEMILMNSILLKKKKIIIMLNSIL